MYKKLYGSRDIVLATLDLITDITLTLDNNENYVILSVAFDTLDKNNPSKSSIWICGVKFIDRLKVIFMRGYNLCIWEFVLVQEGITS